MDILVLVLIVLFVLLVPVLLVATLVSLGRWGRAIFFVVGLVVGYRGSMVGYDIALAAVLAEIAVFVIRTIRERREARLGAVVGSVKPISFWPWRR